MRKRICDACWLGCLVLGACSGASTASETTPSTGGVPSPPVPWGQMEHEAKRAWMIDEVLPRMTDLFQAQDAERYADFSCATCHGASAEERAFAMPSPALPALYPTGSEQQHRMVSRYEASCRFMFTRVVPAMLTLLGAPDYDEATHQGFSCYACHPHAGDEGTTPIQLSARSQSGAPPPSLATPRYVALRSGLAQLGEAAPEP